jgi:hypothetical protein
LATTTGPPSAADPAEEHPARADDATATRAAAAATRALRWDSAMFDLLVVEKGPAGGPVVRASST